MRVERKTSSLLAAGARTLALAAMMVVGALTAFGDATAGRYMVVDLRTGEATYEQATSVDRYNTNDVYKTEKMVFRHVPAGTYYVQGGTQATMATGYWIGIYEVTVGQYALMGNPNASVSATEANMKPKGSAFYYNIRLTDDAATAPLPESPIGKLTARAHAGGGVRGSYLFDLPTEAMWEVAARAMPAGDSSHAAYKYFFQGSGSLSSYAWIKNNASGSAHVVGRKLPNDWGLYDVYGNTAELCRDFFSATMALTQVGNVSSVNWHVMRGGGFNQDSSVYCDSLKRDALASGILTETSDTARVGFRLALVPSTQLLSGQIVEIDIDGDGDPEVVITPTGDGDGAGTITPSGDGSYDVTGPAEIELVDADGVIQVPEGTTVTVGGDGVTTVDEGETVTVVVDNGDGTTTTTVVNGPATIDPDGTITLGEGGSTTSVTTDENGDIIQVEIDIDGDGEPDVIITTTGDDGTITDNGDGSFDVTGEAEIELVDADNVIEVPEGTTVTVGGDGVTTVDEGETVTVDDTTVDGPATIGPDGTITQEGAEIVGPVRITSWQKGAAGEWKLSFTVPKSGVKGDYTKLTPNKSFSVRAACMLSDLKKRDGQACGCLDFTIDVVKPEGDNIVVELSITPGNWMDSSSSMFVSIVDPIK